MTLVKLACSLGVFTLVLVCSGCSVVALVAPPPSPTPVPTAAPEPASGACAMPDGTPLTAAFLPFVTRWADGVVLADATARIALSGPVGQLQAVRRDVKSVTWPACAQSAADVLIQGMDSEIIGYLRFMNVSPADERRYIPQFNENLTYAQLERQVGQSQADALFYADSYAAIATGRQYFGEFGTELAYADGEQARPSTN